MTLPVTSPRADRGVPAAAIVLALVSSVSIQLLNGVAVRATIGVAATVALLLWGAVLRGRPGRRDSADAVLALGALSVFGGVSAIITSTPAIEAWISHASPAAAFLVVNATKLSSILVLAVIIVVYR